MECGFEKCLLDPFGFRLRVAGYVVVLTVFHVDDIKIAVTEEAAEVEVSALIQTFTTKHLGEIEWYMGSGYNRDRKNVTQFTQSVLNRFGVLKSSPIPSALFVDLRHDSEEEPVLDVPFREIVRSLM